MVYNTKSTILICLSTQTRLSTSFGFTDSSFLETPILLCLGHTNVTVFYKLTYLMYEPFNSPVYSKTLRSPIKETIKDLPRIEKVVTN